MVVRSILLRFTIGLAALSISILAVLLYLPVDRLRAPIEAALSRRLGTQVRIHALSRVSAPSFTPLVDIQGLSIDQPGWAGQGHWAEVDHARFRLPLIPALFGRFHPHDLVIDGMRLLLERRRDGKKNWTAGSSQRQSMVSPAGLRIHNSRIVYRDAKRDRAFDARFATRPDGALILSGTGTVRDRPVRIVAQGAAVAHGGPWPFSARIEGPTLRFAIAGAMDRALDSQDMTIDVSARADDLKTLDAIIEAGLFETQAVNLAAHARHEGGTWTITGLRGSVGHSHITGQVSVANRYGRHRIDGSILADPLDFADLSSTEHLAQQAALKRQGKQRLIPDTRVDLAKLAHTDGVIRLDARQTVGSASPPLSSIKATLTLDHGLLSVAPIEARLTKGVVTGSIDVDQRGRAVPLVTIALALTRSDLSAFSPQSKVAGQLAARVRLVGAGRSIGDAVGHSNGLVHLVTGQGRLPARVAAMLGLDAGRALTKSQADQSELRCALLDMPVNNGKAALGAMLLDTSMSQSRGTGQIDLATESVALRLTGAPKKAGLIQLPGAIEIGGTLAKPSVSLPRRDKSAGAVFKSIGRAIKGSQPVSQDVDCTKLVR